MSTTSPTLDTGILPDALRMGAVRLRVRDAARSIAFYRDTVGLTLIGTEGAVTKLGVGSDVLIELEAAPNAGPHLRGATGLFHVALLVPSRVALAVVLRRLIAQGVRLGASDHLVSEALYMDDPDGNGIEIYRDRLPGEWSWDGPTVEMATIHLDLRSLLAEAPETIPLGEPMPDGTVVGHVHLQVGDIATAKRFYAEHLGFDVTTDRYPGALFVSAGRYHHHLGLNVWQSRGGNAPPAGSVGLVHYEVVLPDAAALETVRARMSQAGESVEDIPGGLMLADPWGTRAHFRVA
ncbi:MAG TPA: VOC family protein [Ancylobacter sp.]